MARKLNMVVIASFAAVALLLSSASATTYFVGDSANWNIPSSPNTYSDWAAGNNFVVGDILVFNFDQTRHDVAEVSRSNYDNCNGVNPISRQTSSPANITLQTAGEHHYICTVAGHCNAGQRLAINVAGAQTPSPQPGENSPSPSPRPPTFSPSSPAPSPSTTTSPTTPTTPSTPTTSVPPPEGNSATSLGVAGFSFTALALALLF